MNAQHTTDQPAFAQPAAQYIRVSTGRQAISLEDQAEQIRRYAVACGFEIVTSYIDVGKSGMTLRGRPNFRKLLRDIWDPDRRFDIILVADVSRWGRFLDPDQAAAYEFFCREAGVDIRYVAEPFEEEMPAAANILKHAQRIAAGEYCREISDKVSIGHCQQAALGFFQGGPTPYGFRRVLLSRKGEFRGHLERGEAKATPDEKVRLVIGSADEVKTIKRIFHYFVRRGWNMREIAQFLKANQRKDFRPWNASLVKQVLINPLVTGWYVYNRQTRRLVTPLIDNPETLWKRAYCLPPIISQDVFSAAAERLNHMRRFGMSDDRLLNGLRRLMRQNGDLTTAAIDNCPFIPSASVYAARFGSLQHARDLVDYIPPPVKRRRCRHMQSDQAIFARIRYIYARFGKITSSLIEKDGQLPNPKTLAKRYGSLLKAYVKAGLELHKARPVPAVGAGTAGGPMPAIFAEPWNAIKAAL